MIKKINNNKILIISHIADTDGMGSIILAKKTYINIDYILCELRELPIIFQDKTIESYETIYLCDLPLTPSTIEILNNKTIITKKLKHFDHHISYDENIPNYVNTIPVLNGRKTCGTELFYNYIKNINKNLDNNFYKTLVEAIREQDTWDFKEEKYNAKLLANTLTLIGPEPFIELICSLDDSKEFKLPSLYDDLYKSELKKINNYIEFVNNNLLITKYKKYKVGITISEQYRYIIGDEICKLNPEIDFIMIINYSRNTVSLRCTKENIDLNQISSEFHKDGGGHKKAAGFIIDEESIPKIQKYHNMYLENLKK